MENEKITKNFYFGDNATFIETQNIKVETGANFYNGTRANSTTDETTAIPADKNDERIAQAIASLYEAKEEVDGEERPLFTTQAQWYAVYRVLKEYCNYPAAMSDFYKIITQRGYDINEPKCVYASFRKVPNNYPNLKSKVSTWAAYQDISDKYRKQYKTAAFLLKLLENEE